MKMHPHPPTMNRIRRLNRTVAAISHEACPGLGSKIEAPAGSIDFSTRFRHGDEVPQGADGIGVVTSRVRQLHPEDRTGIDDSARSEVLQCGGLINSCEVVGENRKFADIVVSPFPSDHRAVVAAFSLAFRDGRPN